MSLSRQLAPTISLRKMQDPRSWCALGYNLVQTAGWAHCARLLGRAALDTQPGTLANKTFPAVGGAVVAMQTLALIEPLLSLLRIIPSSMLNVVVQLVARNIVILTAVNRHAALQKHTSVTLFFLAWITTEVIRFPWLVFKTLGEPPHLLSMLRYSAPLVLYPLGGLGEGWAMWRAREAGAKDVLASIGGVQLTLRGLVNYVYLPLYVPGFLFLYMNAFKQYKKQTRRLMKELRDKEKAEKDKERRRDQ